MKLHLMGLEVEASAIRELERMLDFERAEGGIPVRIEGRADCIEVGLKHGEGTIRYPEKIHFFRALGLFVEKARTEACFHLVEHPQFSWNGVMLDVSRNAVMKVDQIKKLIAMMAVMGLNGIMLYTEDTYTVKERPYFGYMRGKYSVQELKECDDYADKFGIEMIPCIQTLAHLAQALKWNYANDFMDTEDILLAEDKQTYIFIEEMIRSASAPFRSNRIHIGMDEAHQLGLGKYLDKHGFRQRFDIMSRHLSQVIGITERYDLAPMIWSDMYFRLGSHTGDYYDENADIPESVIRDMPRNVQFVYWDYYHEEEHFYRSYIQKHKAFGSAPVFAGGIWTWNGVAPNYGKTFATTNAALSACKKEGVREVIATMWGDNGTETNFFSGLLGMQLFAEHGYSETLDPERLKQRFSFCTGGDAESFMNLTLLDETPGVMNGNPKESNPSKFLLWQDILTGLYDRNIQGLPINAHYQQLEARLRADRPNNRGWDFIFDGYEKLCAVLSVKSELGIHLKTHYDRNDRAELNDILERQLPDLERRIRELRAAHRRQWFEVYKPFGWEVLDIRYGGLLARVDTAKRRLHDYLHGQIDRIEELEEERLYFDWPRPKEEGSLGRGHLYHRIVTAGALSN